MTDFMPTAHLHGAWFLSTPLGHGRIREIPTPCIDNFAFLLLGHLERRQSTPCMRIIINTDFWMYAKILATGKT
jgi:hypothetical protein